MSKEIRLEEYESYWECGDGCCTNWDSVSIFHHNGETYEYRGYSTEENLKNFLIDHYELVFNVEQIDDPNPWERYDVEQV